jgi:WS/DGAT/MGAT family acyltransferase
VVAAHERVSAEIPRLRDRVVEPPLPLVQPTWTPDPFFDLANHLRFVDLGGNASQDEVIRLCEETLEAPFDRSKPPWQAIVVTGLREKKAAYLLKIHHSLTDGLGLIQLLELAHSDRPEPRPHTPVVPTTATPRASSAEVLAAGVRDQLTELPRQLEHFARRAALAALDPARTVSEGTRFLQSLVRMTKSSDVPRSPVLSGHGGAGNRLLIVDVPLDKLKSSAKFAGASVNDAFLAAVLGGVRAYHELHGNVVERIPIGIPISLRTDDDPLGGNQFAGARFAAPLAEKDPVARMMEIRNFVLTARDEPAVGFVNTVSPVLTKLPTSMVIELSAKLTATSDLQVSNIRGIGHPLYLAGAEIEGMYPLGPRPGVAAMVAMITYNGGCCVGVNADPDVVTDPAEFADCLRAGFHEVISICSEA